MEEYAHAVDVALRRCLCLTILFRRGIAWRAKRNGIFRLSGLEMACDAEVDQVEMPRGRIHNIRRFQVTEDDGRMACVQVMENGAELQPDIKRFLQRETLIWLT